MTDVTEEEKVWRIPSWCQESGIKEHFVFQLWRKGCGPRRRKFGKITLITESPRAFAERAGTDPDAAA